MTLVDSSVLLDLLTDGQVWADWSQAQLEQAAAAGPLVINDVIYAEISARYPSVDVVDSVIRDAGVDLRGIGLALLEHPLGQPVHGAVATSTIGK